MLKISPDLSLPEEACTETFALLAMRGAGKSNTAVVMAEEMFEAGIHWVAIDPKGDWWGIRSAADGTSPGLPVTILGGQHGDVPLEADKGKMVADLVVDELLTCILDLSEMTEGEKIRFLAGIGSNDGFAAQLYRRKNESQPPTHVFLEEAHDYIPQSGIREKGKLVHDCSRLATMGRSRGLGCTSITQRSARLHKDVLTQTDTLIAMRNTGPQDRKAVGDWVDYHDASPEILRSLPSLEDGEAWFVSPQKLHIVKRVRLRRRMTYDSGATPTFRRSGKANIQPRTVADIDRAVLVKRMQETIEKAQATDPAVLQKRVRELQGLLAKAQANTTVEQVSVLMEEDVKRLYDLSKEIREGLRDAIGVMFDEYQRRFEAALRGLEEAIRSTAGRSVAPVAPRPEPIRRAAERHPSSQESATVVSINAGASVRLKKGARRMLQALAQQHPGDTTKAQLGALARLSWKGGTFGTYLSNLRQGGYVEEIGDVIRITDAGFDYLGVAAPAPQSREETVAMWRGTMKAGQRRMFDYLLDSYPEWVTKAQIAEAAGIDIEGGTFGTYLSNIRRNGLLEQQGRDLFRVIDVLAVGA